MKILYYIAQGIGFVAVTLYLLGYLQKKRKSIIAFNLTSRVMYIAQYILLGAFEGAVLDVVGALSSVFAGKRIVPLSKNTRSPSSS